VSGRGDTATSSVLTMPALGPDEGVVDIVGGDRDLGEIVEEIVQ
jgi:hypothetical protein